MTSNDIIQEQLDLTIEELYNDEHNYNNADITSGQRAMDRTAIEEELYNILKKRLNK